MPNPDDRITNEPSVEKRRYDDPDPAGELPSLSGGGSGGLSSLAQSARQKHLKSARTTLIVVGLLTVGFNILAVFLLQSQLETEMRKAGINPNNPPAEVRAAIALDYAATIGFVIIGVVFILLGVFVQSHPVFCTVTGLVLYIGGWLVSGMLDPQMFAAGIVIKIIIIVALAKAIQAALAYERETAPEAA